MSQVLQRKRGATDFVVRFFRIKRNIAFLVTAFPAHQQYFTTAFSLPRFVVSIKKEEEDWKTHIVNKCVLRAGVLKSLTDTLSRFHLQVKHAACHVTLFYFRINIGHEFALQQQLPQT